MKVNPYINFNGNCREAMTFYASCFDGQLEVQTFADAPPDVGLEKNNNILHARLTKDDFLIMASDCPDPTLEQVPGNNISLAVDCKSIDEVNKLFNAVGNGGKILMPLQDTFWGARFGMLIDKFGIHWMFNYDHKG